MTLMRLLTLRSIRQRPVRFLLSAFGIILGVAGMFSIRITNQSALESLSKVFKSTSGNVDLAITSTNSDSFGFPERILGNVSGLPGVQAAVPLIQMPTVLADEVSPDQIGFGFFGTSSGGLLLYGVDPVLELQAREYEMVQGEFLSGDNDAREVVLVEGFAQENQIEVGKTVEILTPNGIERLDVIGLMSRDGPGMINGGSFGVIPVRTAQNLFNRSGKLDQIDIVAAGDQGDLQKLDELRVRLQDRLGRAYTVTSPANQGQRSAQMLSNYQIGLNLLSAIALFVGAFLIYNSFAMNVVERTREIGMLRAIGMTRRQVVFQMMLEAVVLGLLGSLLGVALGIFLARGLTNLMAVIMDQKQANILIDMNVVLFSMTIGTVVTMLAALIPVWQAGRISPIEALRIRGSSKEGWLLRRGWIPGLLLIVLATAILIYNPFPYDPEFRLGTLTVVVMFLGLTLLIPASVNIWQKASQPLIKMIYGGVGGLGSRNVQRARLRTALTVAALLVGVSMVLVVQGMTGSFSQDIKGWMESYIGGDLYVSSMVPLQSELGSRFMAVEGVAHVAAIRNFEVELLTPEGTWENLTFVAVDPLQYQQVTTFTFSNTNIDPVQAVKALADGNALFITNVLAEKYGYQIGDSVRLKTRLGPYDFTVVGITIDFSSQGLLVHGSWSDMERYFRLNDANTFLIKTTEGYSVEEVKLRIDQQYRKRYQLILESNESIRDRIFTLMDQAFSMFDVLALLAIVVASLGVINTLTMNVLERTREIGMLRAVGMTRGQVIRMVLAEAVMMGLIGGVLGVAAGVVLTHIFLLGMNAMSGYQVEYIWSPTNLLITFVASLVLSQVAAVLPSRRAAAVKVLEAVHYE